MDIDVWLRKASVILREAGIESARLDCLILLEDAVGRERAWLLAHTELGLTDAQTTTLNNKVAQRAKHVPLAYIRGHVEFYGREFAVNEQVLVPRPETESMISLLQSLAKSPAWQGRPVIIDVGTGSGALAITAKLELPAAEVYGTDIDPRCLTIARQNAASWKVDVRYLEADLLQPASSPGMVGSLPRADIVLANLPYVPDDYQINTAAGHEPKLAIFGGPDGLELYRQLFAHIAAATLPRPAYIITEALLPDHHTLADIAQKNGYTLQSAEGLAQLYVPAKD